MINRRACFTRELELTYAFSEGQKSMKKHIYEHTLFTIENLDGCLHVYHEETLIGKAGGSSKAKGYEKIFTNTDTNHGIEDGLIANTARFSSVDDAVDNLCVKRLAQLSPIPQLAKTYVQNYYDKLEDC